MALEEDEQAFSLLYERIGAPVFQLRKDAIAAGRQHILGYVVPPGMRHTKMGRNARCQTMVRYTLAFEHPEQFFAETPPCDAIDSQHGSVCCQATPDGGMGVVLRPLD